MRKVVVASLVLVLIPFSLPGASAVESVTGHYTGTMGQSLPGTPVFPLGLFLCTTKNVDNAAGTQFGCIGGDIVVAPSGKAYLRSQAIITDLAFGPNVYGFHCLRPPTPADNLCLANRDAMQAGCGVLLQADANGIHPGSPTTYNLAFTLMMDSTTSQTCVGTTGIIAVVFIE